MRHCGEKISVSTRDNCVLKTDLLRDKTGLIPANNELTKLQILANPWRRLLPLEESSIAPNAIRLWAFAVSSSGFLVSSFFQE
jgi:hypothetical protein